MQVNARLSNEESADGISSSGDPLRLKVQWPTPIECGACHAKDTKGELQAEVRQIKRLVTCERILDLGGLAETL